MTDRSYPPARDLKPIHQIRQTIVELEKWEAVLAENEKLKEENQKLREANKDSDCYKKQHFEDFAKVLKMVRRAVIADTENKLTPVAVVDDTSKRMQRVFRSKGIGFNKTVFENWVYDIYKDAWF